MRKKRIQSAVHQIKAKKTWACLNCGAMAMNSVCSSCGGKAVQFDSKKEARRWAELKFMERNGQIRNLRRQVRFDLVPGEYTISGKPRYYLADFVYNEGGVTVIEDVKGNAMTREAAFKLDVLKMVLAKDGQSGFVIRLH